MRNKALLLILTLLMSFIGLVPDASAHRHHGRGYGYGRYYGGCRRGYNPGGYYRGGSYWSYHPYVKGGLIGAGIGAAAGGLLSNGEDPVAAGVRGAVVGTGAGLAYQYLKGRSYGGYYGRGW